MLRGHSKCNRYLLNHKTSQNDWSHCAFELYMDCNFENAYSGAWLSEKNFQSEMACQCKFRVNKILFSTHLFWRDLLNKIWRCVWVQSSYSAELLNRLTFFILFKRFFVNCFGCASVLSLWGQAPTNKVKEYFQVRKMGLKLYFV